MDSLDLIFNQLCKDVDDDVFVEGKKLDTAYKITCAVSLICNIVVFGVKTYMNSKCIEAGNAAREEVEFLYRKRDINFIPLSKMTCELTHINKLLISSDLQKIDKYKRKVLSNFVNSGDGSWAPCKMYYLNGKPLCASCNGDPEYVYALSPKLQKYEKYYLAAMAMEDKNLNGYVLMQEVLDDIKK